MTAKRLLEYLESIIIEEGEHVPVILEYPNYRCEYNGKRLPGLAHVDDIYFLYGDGDNLRTEVRLIIKRDDYP